MLRHVDGDGYTRTDSWSPGLPQDVPEFRSGGTRSAAVAEAIARATQGDALREEVVVSFVPGADVDQYVKRRTACVGDNGEVVGYVVNRNINYTNVCCSTAADFVRFRSPVGTCAALPMTSLTRRLPVVCARLGTGVPPKCACRAAFTPPIRATPISSCSTR